MNILKEIYLTFTVEGLASFVRVFIGFIIALVLGVGLGSLIFYFKKSKNYLCFFAEFLKSIPPIAWIPLAIIVLGLGDVSAIFIVFLGGFFPIFLNTVYGVLSIPKKYLEVAENYGVKGFIFYRKILLGYLLPHIFVGIKLGIGVAWMSVIAAEMIGVQSGLGYYIQINRLLLNTQNVLIGVALIGLIGFIMTKLVEVIEKKVIVWQEVRND